ncbi:MAG: TonB-dependent receptor [Caulobacteraceae bacterium]
MKDLPLVKAFNLDLGYRYSDYDQTGGVSTYKADFDWTVVDSGEAARRLRRAIRAPNVVELFNPAVAGPALLGTADPCDYDSVQRTGSNAAAITALCQAQGIPASVINSYKLTFLGTQAIQTGNLDLKPEKADTFTAGVVYRPTFSSPLFSRVSASVDYYNIKLSDAISTLSADLVFARCYGADYNPTFSASNEYCAAINRNPATGTPDSTLTPYFNLGGLKTSGIDLPARLELRPRRGRPERPLRRHRDQLGGQLPDGLRGGGDAGRWLGRLHGHLRLQPERQLHGRRQRRPPALEGDHHPDLVARRQVVRRPLVLCRPR